MKRRRSRRRQRARTPATAGPNLPADEGVSTVDDGTESEGEETADATTAVDPDEESMSNGSDREEPAQLEAFASHPTPAPASGPAAEATIEESEETVSVESGPETDETPGDARTAVAEPARPARSGAIEHELSPTSHSTADRIHASSSGSIDYSGAGSNRPADPLAQARELEQAGQVDRAMNLYREILRTQPSNLEAHFALGSLHEKIGQHLKALEQFEMAKRADPENVDAALRHARAMAVLGRYDAAERELRRAVRLDPARAEIFTTLGTIGVRRGLYAQAELDLKRAIELDPESAVAHHYRGEALNQLGRVDEALDMLEQAARLDPKNPKTYYVMGIVLDKKQRPQEAGAMFRRSRELTPG